jgi:diguanylate cyclase (GGDEF)-like protein
VTGSPISPWLVPAGIELCIFALFGAVLFYLRHSLGKRGIILWLSIWGMRVLASMIALRYLSRAESFILLFYTPLQLAIALALVVIAFRLQNQKEQFRRVNDELERLKRESQMRLEVDAATGLLNRYALAHWMEEETDFKGWVVVCDLDDFKLVNDLFGHLAGDEILHGMGQLIRASIRHEDMAFRWGGDELVIFFHSTELEVVDARMRLLEDRLQHFQIRNLGPVAIRFSWGKASTEGRGLRESLDEADRLMYEAKRDRRTQFQGAKPSGN